MVQRPNEKRSALVGVRDMDVLPFSIVGEMLLVRTYHVVGTVATGFSGRRGSGEPGLRIVREAGGHSPAVARTMSSSATRAAPVRHRRTSVTPSTAAVTGAITETQP